MPKKFKENTKAAEAKARKNAVKEELELKKQKELDDQLWMEDDKHVLKKLQRKEDKDKKKADQLDKKKELQKLAEEEMAQLAKTSGKCATVKITRAQIESRQMVAPKEAPPKKVVTPEEPIEENLNKLMNEENVATNIDEAISILNGSRDVEIDMHPEKRMKAAYMAYEAKMMPQLKNEYPTLRHSQLHQILRKEWMKSPENPVNQALKSSMKK